MHIGGLTGSWQGMMTPEAKGHWHYSPAARKYV